MAVSDAEFGKLLEEIAPQLESYVLQTTGSRELAENLTRATILKALASEAQLVGPILSPLDLSDPAQPLDRSNPGSGSARTSSPPIRSTRSRSIRSRRRQVIWRACARKSGLSGRRLSLEHRQVIQLIVINDQNPTDVAADAGCRRGAR